MCLAGLRLKKSLPQSGLTCVLWGFAQQKLHLLGTIISNYVRIGAYFNLRFDGSISNQRDYLGLSSHWTLLQISALFRAISN